MKKMTTLMMMGLGWISGSGCSVDPNVAASDALLGVFTSAMKFLVSGLINGIVPPAM